MCSLIRSVVLGLTAAAVFAGVAGAQQSLKDVWVATDNRLLALEDGQLAVQAVDLVPRPRRSFRALAFQRPVLGTSSLEVRGLIAVDDGTKIWRFETSTPDVPPRLLFNAAAHPGPGMLYVTAVAVADDNRILISGFSRRLRFEIWEARLNPTGPPTFYQGASNTPALLDAVYVNPEEVGGPGPLAGGGLLATTGKQILFYPRGTNAANRFKTAVVLADDRSLSLPLLTVVTSVDLVQRAGTWAQQPVLMMGTSDRKLLTRPANLARAVRYVVPFATVGLASPLGTSALCRLLPTQLIVRNAQGGEDTSTFVADSTCQQLARYDVPDDLLETPSNPADAYAAWSSPLLALAIGEGKTVVCESSPCELITGAFEATIDTEETTALLVLQLPDLCDPRVSALCPGAEDPPVDETGALNLNALLPPGLQAALGETQLTIPPYMFSAHGNGRFGAVFIQADDVSADARAQIVLEIAELIDDELGVAEDLERLTFADPVRVLNQDIAAYSPDNPDLPTVRGFEATPITTGEGSMEADMRGFSAVLYGLQHDVYPPSDRNLTVGIPAETELSGITPGTDCELTGSVESYYDPDETDTEKYFFNLVACLFTDLELLLEDVIPVPGEEEEFGTLEDLLDDVKDDLIDALDNAWFSEEPLDDYFQAVLDGLDAFDDEVAETDFTGIEIYQNELLVRSKVLKFNIVERAIPSIPLTEEECEECEE